ncbi:MAG: DUF1259 domain-containing protein [Actinobacteria bacterium]|nr:DUF1259 domain-containing protein [Actinomycetota bacterium]
MKTRISTFVVVLAAALVVVAAGGAAASARTAVSLPVVQIEQQLHAKGQVSDGVLSVEIDRSDLGTHRLQGRPVTAPFEINGTLTFQPLSGGRALFNGDFPLKPGEINGFVDALLRNHLAFQAEHQHFYDLTPEVWFVHFRGLGDPVSLAAGVYAAMRSTSVKLPQAPPPHPHTPFDVGRLKTILGSSSATVGSGGVVTLTLTQKQTVRLDGVHLNQNANAETNIAFEPLNAGGSLAAAVPDFGMFAWQIDNVIGVMRAHGWDIGCLYNQETAEVPQLYFSHDLKVGNPYQLAQEIRDGLDQMNVE